MRRILVVTALILTVSVTPAHATQRLIPNTKPITVATLQARIKALEARIAGMVVTPGPRGETGSQGPQGLPGRDGKDGASGAKGETGAKGEIGAKGEPGKDGESITGPTGPAGADGKGLPSGTLILIGGSCPTGTTLEGKDYGWRVYSGNPFTGTGSELWITACRVN